MIISIFSGVKVYNACEKLFDSLYSNSELFKGFIDKDNYACVDFDSLCMCINGISSGLSAGTVREMLSVFFGIDYFNGSDIVKIHFSGVFKFKCGFKYLGNVIVKKDFNTDKSVVLYANCNDSRSTNIRDVSPLRDLYSSSSIYSWKEFISPMYFKGLLDRLRCNIPKLEDMDYVLKLYMDSRRLIVGLDLNSSSFTKISVSEDKVIYGICNDIIQDLLSFGKPVKEIYQFPNPEGMVAYRLNLDGECTLVMY